MPDKDIFTMKFKRVSSSKTIKITYDKTGFIKKYIDPFELHQLKMKVLTNKANEDETLKFKNIVNKMVKDLLINKNNPINIQATGNIK